MGLPNVRALWADCSPAWIADVRSRYSLTPGQRLIHYEYDNVEREVRRDRFKERYQYTLFGVMNEELEPSWTAESAFHKNFRNDRLGPYFSPPRLIHIGSRNPKQRLVRVEAKKKWNSIVGPQEVTRVYRQRRTQHVQ